MVTSLERSLRIIANNLTNNWDPVIVMGDFNLPDINWATLTGSTAISNAFCDLVFELNFAQLVSQSTHSHGNILDLVIKKNLFCP